MVGEHKARHSGNMPAYQLQGREFEFARLNVVHAVAI